MRYTGMVVRRTLERTLPSKAKTVVESSKSINRMPCSSAHLSSMKLPSAPESIRAMQEAEEPGQRRSAEKVVRVFGDGEKAVALDSTPLFTGELWLLVGTMRQSDSRSTKVNGQLNQLVKMDRGLTSIDLILEVRVEPLQKACDQGRFVPAACGCQSAELNGEVGHGSPPLT